MSEHVLTYLMSINMADFESDFRALLNNTSANCGNPKTRDFVIATVALLMQRGGLPWGIGLHTATHLNRRTDEQLKQDVVAIINGDILMLPDTEDEPRLLDLVTLREMKSEEVAGAFVTTIFSVSKVWDHALTILV